jgi:hypothetical protein
MRQRTIEKKYSIVRCRILLQISAVLVSICLIASADALPAAAAQTSPIERAVRFLLALQVARPLDVMENGLRVVDFPGDCRSTSACEDLTHFACAMSAHSTSRSFIMR